MFITTPEGLQIYYQVKGEGTALLLLHGWGGSSQNLHPLLNHFCRQFRVFSLDLPGFGRSSPPQQAWGSREYAQCLHQIQQQLGIERCHIIAHSFGGRIAIILAAQYPKTVSKLVLTGSAGLPPRRGPEYYLKVYLFKLSRQVLSLAGTSGQKMRQAIARRLGSTDYNSASPQMRSILVKMVNEDLTEFLPRIKVPTLLVWGENDRATPLAMGKLMNKLIPGSQLLVLPGAGHFAHLEKTAEFCAAASDFLGKD